MPPPPESNESELERFKRFAKAILAVLKSGINTEKQTALLDLTPEQALARLEVERQSVDASLEEVRQIRLPLLIAISADLRI